MASASPADQPAAERRVPAVATPPVRPPRKGKSRPVAQPPPKGTGVVGAFNRALGLLKLRLFAAATQEAEALRRNQRFWRGPSRELAAAALYNLALAFLVRGKPRIARRLLRAIPASTAAHGPARRLLGVAPRPASQPLSCVAHYRARRYRAARRCFRGLLPRTGPDAQILYAIGYASYQLREHRAALGAFQRVLLLRPADGDALFMAGLARLQLGHHRRALGLFRRALQAGLKSESPAEARRYVRMLRAVLASRLRSGWLWAVSLRLGYDTHPRLGGSAAAAGTSDGSTAEGSGFSSMGFGVGYRWLRALRRRPNHVLRGALSVGYRFHQLVVFSDLEQQVIGRSWRMVDVTGGLSLQTHALGLEARLLGGRWQAGLRLGGHVELSGLQDMSPLLAGGDLQADVAVRWHPVTTSHLEVRYSPQGALSSGMDYLTGHGLVSELRQSLRYKRFRASVGYRLGVWWLGRLVTPETDCEAGEPCGLDIPYSNHVHLGQLRLGLRAARWLNLDGALSVAHRTYWDPGLYRPAFEGPVELQRIDLIQDYRLSVRFQVRKGMHLALAYSFTRNRSTIDEESVGIEEGYYRHRIWASFAYEAW